jgi:hypothetical protein
MPTNIRIIHAHEFVRATPDGELDLEASKKGLIEIASAAAHARLVDYDILLDTRKAHVRMNAIDLWHLAAELSKIYQPYNRKIAVLCPVEEFDNAAFFALCAQNRGFRVNAFTSFEDAIEWLIGMSHDT